MMPEKRVLRKMYSEVQKRAIAYRQKWMCVGELCQGVIHLGVLWQLDHVVPLFMGGSNDPCNLAILCSACHDLKTQRERVNFYFEKRLQLLNESDSQLANDSQRFKRSEHGTHSEHPNTCRIYLHRDKKVKRWRVRLSKSSKYFSTIKFGTVENAQKMALDWCQAQGLEVVHITKVCG